MGKNNEILEFLKGLGFFDSLEASHLEFLAGCGERREVDSDEVLFRYDDKASEFFIVAEGEVVLEVAALEGPSLKVQEVDSGKVIGWSWLIPPYRWNFQGRAEKPSVVYAFDGDKVRERCEEDHTFGYELLKLFAELMSIRLAYARDRMVDEWQVPGFA